MKVTNILSLGAALALTTATSSAAISVISTGTGGTGTTANSWTVSFDATGADKLVVVVSGEHGFNNNAGQVNTLEYDGVALTAVPGAYRTALTGGTDTLYNGIFYLDNPVTTSGLISVSAETRGVVTAFALTGTAAGAGNGAISLVGTRSVDLATSGSDSLVIASFGVGGNGNTGSTTGVTADAPLTTVSNLTEGSNWDGHTTGQGLAPGAGTNSYSFTGGNESGGFVVAAEFLPIPEPSSLALLGVAGLAFLRRRR